MLLLLLLPTLLLPPPPPLLLLSPPQLLLPPSPPLLLLLRIIIIIITVIITIIITLLLQTFCVLKTNKLPNGITHYTGHKFYRGVLYFKYHAVSRYTSDWNASKDRTAISRRFSLNSCLIANCSNNPYTEFHPNRTLNTGSTCRNLWTCISKVWLFAAPIFMKISLTQ